MKTKNILSGLTVVVLLLSANANAIIIDFNGTAVGDFYTADYFEDGFRMRSIVHHYDFLSGSPVDGSNYMSVDNAGSGVEPGPLSIVRFDKFGAMFDLVGLVVVKGDYAASINSSAGGMLALDSAGLLGFAGDVWSNLQWVELVVNSEDVDNYLHVDSIEFNAVPVPASLALLGLGLGILGFFPRHKK